MQKENKIAILDMNLKNNTISLRKDTVTYENGEELTRAHERCAFVPGDIEKVREYTGLQSGELIDLLNERWTPEVIADYQAMVAAEMAKLEAG